MIEIGSKRLTLEDVSRVALEGSSVRLKSEAARKLKAARKWIEPLLESSEAPYYGINTGFGSFKNVRIPKEDLQNLQVNLIRSHAVGVGPDLSIPVVRAMMLLRAHTVSLGFSGVRPQTVERFVQMLNRGVTPLIPSRGSVGASGDLAPLAHLALALLGEGDVEYKGRKLSAQAALKKCGIDLLQPEAKEALALLNGTQMMTAVGTLALLKAEHLMKHFDIAAAMTLEATYGSPKAFDHRVHELRPHKGQNDSAQNLRKLTADSEIYASHIDCDRVQDAYSIRCSPQVHGASRDMLSFVRSVLETEINSVTDNPILLHKEDEIISAGNFHGQPIAVAMDAMALALTSTGSISERRTARLLNPVLSELPAGLVKEAGLNSGLMMLQVTSASLVNECKTLSHPSSVDSIPTWADQEDHVSMGAFAARKAADIVDLLNHIVAIEFLCAAQALEFRKPLRPARGVQAAYEVIRKVVPPLQKDRVLTHDLRAVEGLIDQGFLLSSVQEVVGGLI